MKKRLRKGFTLVEVLIVVVILGILASTVLPQFNQANTDAQQAALVQNLQTLRSQIQLYKFQHGGLNPAQTATQSQDFKNAMLLASDARGVVTGNGSKPYGPYILGSLPANPYTGGKGVKLFIAPLSAATPDETLMDGSEKVGWLYSPTEGLIKANNTGVATDGVTLLSTF